VQAKRGTGAVHLLRSAVKFGLVGIVNTGVYYGTYLALRPSVPYLAAHVLALAVAMVASFFLNCYWTFRTRPTWRKFALFPLTNAVNYLMITVGVVVLVEWIGMDSRIAPLVAAAAAIPLTFVLSRRVLSGMASPPVATEGDVVSVAPLSAAPDGSPQS
jgi:putative flippase GtrA